MILVESGRAAIAAAIKAQPIHLAWGSGSASWDTTPVPETIDLSALTLEVGRRVATQVEYCVPDVAGTIVIPSGRFTISQTATNHLYMRFAFDYADATSETIREIGVFTGTVKKATVPDGTLYLLPADIETPGTMLVVERVTAFTRTSSVRQAFEIVVTL